MDIFDKDPLPPDPILVLEESLEESIRLLKESGDASFLPRLEAVRARFRDAEPAYDICKDLLSLCDRSGGNFAGFSLSDAPDLDDEKKKNYAPTLERLKKALHDNAKLIVELGPLT